MCDKRIYDINKYGVANRKKKIEVPNEEPENQDENSDTPIDIDKPSDLKNLDDYNSKKSKQYQEALKYWLFCKINEHRVAYKPMKEMISILNKNYEILCKISPVKTTVKNDRTYTEKASYL